MTQLVNYFDYGFIWCVEINFSDFEPLIFTCKTPESSNCMLQEILEDLEENNLKKLFPIDEAYTPIRKDSRTKTVSNYEKYIEDNIIIVLKIKENASKKLLCQIQSVNYPLFISEFKRWTSKYL